MEASEKRLAGPQAEDEQIASLTYSILTFGCQMNYSDSERVAAVLEKTGYRRAPDDRPADLVIFNTCSIRQKGEDRVYGLLENFQALKAVNPRLLVGLTGCMVRQTSTRNSPPEKKDPQLKILRAIDFVFRINDSHILPSVLAEAEPRLEMAGEPEFAQPGTDTDYLQIEPHYSSTFQAFVPVQIGCDKYCTYCIVPYSRGREKSRPLEEIVTECRRLVEKGCLEINLVGQTVNSYGLSQLDSQSRHFDWYHQPRAVEKTTRELPFIRLLRELDKLSALGLSRLRYSSSHPRDFGRELVALHAELPTLCPHLHLPLQAGDDAVLARMNRKYTYAQFREKIADFRRAVPGAAVTTDLIVGFCGETDEQFENTVRALEELRFDQVFLARYSQRPGTVAARSFPDDVPREVKAQRWHRLNDVLRRVSLEQNRQYAGRTLEVLVERHHPASGEVEGRSRENKLVQFPGGAELIGTLQSVEITDALEWLLRGNIQGQDK